MDKALIQQALKELGITEERLDQAEIALFDAISYYDYCDSYSQEEEQTAITRAYSAQYMIDVLRSALKGE